MRFAQTFKRFVGGGTPVLGADAVPTRPPGNEDNILSARFMDTTGFFGQRLAIAMSGPATTDDKTVALYIWEDTLGKWFLCPTTTKLSQDSVKYFDIPILISPAQNRRNTDRDNTNSGSLEVCVIVSADGVAPNGQYDFAMSVTAN
jgi:hypothetical protein